MKDFASLIIYFGKFQDLELCFVLEENNKEENY